MPLHPYKGTWPRVDATAYVAPGAQVIGDVTLGPRTGVWFNAVIRGDSNFVRVGAGTNIQDGAILHVDAGEENACIIGEGCTVGHRAIVHGCRVGDGCLIGMGAIVLNRARLGDGCVVAAGALVPEGKEFPPRSLLVGVPARVVRTIDDAEWASLVRSGVEIYIRNAADYAGAQ